MAEDFLQMQKVPFILQLKCYTCLKKLMELFIESIS